MIKAVIFDHDGVLVDTEPIQWTVWNKVLGEYGVVLDKHIWAEKARGSTTREVLKFFLGKKYPTETLENIAHYKTELSYEASKKAVPIKGVRKFIKLLVTHGFKIAVASSGDKRKIDYTLSHLQLRQYISTVITQEDIVHPKPNPEIFLKAAQKLGVGPESCVVFEDAFNGLKAAKSARMKTILVESSHSAAETNFELYDYAIQDFTQISLKHDIFH